MELTRRMVRERTINQFKHIRTCTRNFTGFEVGLMPPVGHKERIPTVIDQNVMSLSKVYGGDGVSKVLIEIDPCDIAKLADARVADICE